jgi:hypothetical protein
VNVRPPGLSANFQEFRCNRPATPGNLRSPTCSCITSVRQNGAPDRPKNSRRGQINAHG